MRNSILSLTAVLFVYLALCILPHHAYAALSAEDIPDDFFSSDGFFGGDTSLFDGVGDYEILPPVPAVPGDCATTCIFCACSVPIQLDHTGIQLFNSSSLRLHRNWMIDTFMAEHILPAMAYMTVQMSTIAMQQMKIIGNFFDAKHQLETQRLFQELMAKAHADYQTSDGICDIGSSVRGLASSERKADLTRRTLSASVMQRQLRTGHNLSYATNTDLLSRIDFFRDNFCDQSDNAFNLTHLCVAGSAPRETRNKDVNYTRAVDGALTLEVDFSEESAINSPDISADERVVFGLMANLFGSEPMPLFGRRLLSTEEGVPRGAAYAYMDMRSVAAKRNVAENSISAIIADRSSGDKDMEHAPFVKSALLELGVPEDEINFVIGEDPSYYAQMDVLTKKIYQNPVFFTELYDTQTNVLRKGVAIRAIGLMQDRDMYKSLLRNEATYAVALESMLHSEQKKVYANMKNIGKVGP